MARYTFVTTSHVTGDETTTVDILTEEDVRKIVEDLTRVKFAIVDGELKTHEEKIAAASSNAVAAVVDTAAARSEMKKLVETAREVFHEVIEELLEPHYRRLAEHLESKSKWRSMLRNLVQKWFQSG